MAQFRHTVERHSAGLLLFRKASDTSIEVMIAHMGGPFWANRDSGGWSIPKGEYEPGEEPLVAARREFLEELGSEVPPADFIDLGEVRQSSGKRIRAWAVEADLDVSHITSNPFEMEWPRGSGRMERFPEIDRAAWFDLDTARAKLVNGQVPFVDLLIDRLGLNA
jgi:predicted NUDIX family NTP pyrophosphohydrolase